MEKALIVIGVLVPSFFVFALFAYAAARFLVWYYAPEVGSNAHLREWLAAGKSWDDYPRA